MHKLKFKCRDDEMVLLDKISSRAKELLNINSPTVLIDLRMDIAVCHLNDCKLDLEKLLKADDFNFSHDVCGISRHLNRRTGKLENHFLPRCAWKKA